MENGYELLSTINGKIQRHI